MAHLAGELPQPWGPALTTPENAPILAIHLSEEVADLYALMVHATVCSKWTLHNGHSEFAREHGYRDISLRGMNAQVGTATTPE